MTETFQEHIAYIDRAQEETRAFVAEQHHRLATQNAKLGNAALPADWPFVVVGMIIGAALSGAGLACAKLIG